MSDGAIFVRSIYELLSEPNNEAAHAALVLAFRLAHEAPATDGAALAVCNAAFQGELLGDFKSSAELYGLLIALPSCSGDLAGKALFRQAQCLEALGDWLGAARVYPRALQFLQEPGTCDIARFRLAMLHIAAEEYEAAAELLESTGCTDDNPHVDSSAVVYYLAHSLLLCGQAAKGRNLLEQLLRSEPRNSRWFIQTRHRLADMCYSEGDLQGAKEHLLSLLQAAGNDPQTHFLLCERIAALSTA